MVKKTTHFLGGLLAGTGWPAGAAAQKPAAGVECEFLDLFFGALSGAIQIAPVSFAS